MAPLTTWGTVQSRFALDASQETEIERLISLATARCERYTGRTLAATDVTLQLDGDGTQTLDLGQWPVNSVDAVRIDEDRAFGQDTEVDDYVVISSRGHLHRDARWPRGVQTIQVEANVGYEQVPEDLEESIVQLVGYWHQSASVVYLQGESGEPESWQNQYAGPMDVPFQVHKIWSQFRRVPL